MVFKMTINIGGIAYTSEWMQYQLLEALFNAPETKGRFALSWIAGAETSLQGAEKRILEEVIEKSKELKETIGTDKEWRVKNTTQEARNILTLLDRLNNGVMNGAANNAVKYVQMNRRGSDLPLHAYDEVDAVAVFTPNAMHLNYVEDALRLGKHVLCEKPLVVVTDSYGKADRRKLDRLVELNEMRGKNGTIVIDAEHYSYKVPSKIFFDNIEEMVAKYGQITRVNGSLEEKDNPEKDRTKKLLCRENQTGLVLDTGVHILSLITGIGGTFGDITSAAYGMFPGYDVETSAHIKLYASGAFFRENAGVTLSLGKFIDHYRQQKTEETKNLEFVFEKDGNETTVVVDYKKGTVSDSTGTTWDGHHKYNTIEYVNILNELYECIAEKRKPRTGISNSIAILDAIYRMYKKFPVEQHIDGGVYK